MKRPIYFLAALLVLLTSCEDWFDVSPKSQLKADDLLSTSEGYRDALIGCYGTMAEEDLYGGQLTMTWMDVLGQYYSTASATLNNFEYAYAYDYSNATEEDRKDNVWKNEYNVVANLNSLLDGIDGKRGIFATGEYQLIKGEALALRAFIHLDLLRLFAPSPAMEGGSTSKAIPYVDRYTNQLFARLTTEQVLGRIIVDLDSARNLLAAVDPYGPQHAQYDMDALEGVWKGREYRMNYYAVTALLARTLLYRGAAGDRDRAYACALEVINSGLFPLVSGSDITGADKNGFTSENIFALERDGLKDEVADKYFHVTNASTNYLALGTTVRNKVYPTSLDMDYRLQWWLQNSGSYNLVVKYDYAERIPLLKVSEMYLIAAETATDIATANRWFNTLQYHRGLADTELTADNLADKLLAEYAKEFLGEGQLFFAYKRLAPQKTPINNTSLTDCESVYVLPLPAENTYFAE